MTEEDKAQIQMLEQLAQAMQLLLRATTLKSRTVLAQHGLTKQRRIVLQRSLFCIVGSCRVIKSKQL